MQQALHNVKGVPFKPFVNSCHWDKFFSWGMEAHLYFGGDTLFKYEYIFNTDL